MREVNAALSRITAPTIRPVTATECREHVGLSVDDATFDTMLDRYIRMSTDQCEERIGRVLITQTWRQFQDRLPGTNDEWWDGVRQLPVTEIRGHPAPILLMRYPVQSVTSVKLYDEDDTATTVSTDIYQVDTASEPPRVAVRREQVWPAVTLRAMNGVEVEYQAGYGDTAASVPASLRQGIIAMVGYLFEHRGACDAGEAASKSGAASLWRPYRLGRI